MLLNGFMEDLVTAVIAEVFGKTLINAKKKIIIVPFCLFTVTHQLQGRALS